MDLKPLTLISGYNNTGKSSILDSFLLFQDYANPEVFLKLLGFRGVRNVELSPRSLWEPLFHNMDTINPIEIRINKDDFLRLEKNNKYTLSKGSASLINSKTFFSSVNYALSCDFQRKEKRFTGDYLLGNENISGNLVLLSRDNAAICANDEYIQYIGPHISLDDITVADWFGNLELTQGKTEKQKLIEILSILDNSITDITTIAAGGLVQLYFTNKQEIKLPFHIMGDGIKKLLHIALVLRTKPGCILLLDEVENGLHYSLYSKFWEILSTLAILENSQIIATTHSYECIAGALEGVTAAKQEENFAYVRLDKNDNIVTPKKFSSNMLKRAIDSDWEVR
ncbi:MAG: ATP-binding protein [Treponema sp.]|nr:ATP-binding protein [Treponema sp.]